jgi:hypothetical protein
MRRGDRVHHTKHGQGTLTRRSVTGGWLVRFDDREGLKVMREDALSPACPTCWRATRVVSQPCPRCAS